mgnify:CR=1 FL=1
MELENIMWEEVMAIIPDYDDKGNCTKLYMKNGEIQKMNKSFRAVRNKVCKYYLMDFKAAREHFREISFMKNLVPISFDGEDVFVYIKVRKPKFKNDGAHGLVNTTYIEKVTKDKDKVMVKFYNNENIKSLWTADNTEKHIDRGNKLKQQCRDNFRIINNDYDLNEKYGKPVTRKDLILVMEKTLEVLER